MCRNAVLYIWKNINQYSAGSHMDERFGKPFFPHFHEVLKLNSWQDEHMIDNTYFRQGMPPNVTSILHTSSLQRNQVLDEFGAPHAKKHHSTYIIHT